MPTDEQSSLSKKESYDGVEQDNEVMISRGTSSPKRRRSPLNRPKTSDSSNVNAGLMNPIQLDNSTSFNNDIEYEEIASSSP